MNTTQISGQSCSDYPCVIKKVKILIASKQYRLAFEQLESAQGYPNKNDSEISDLRKQLFNAIEEEKVEAIKARDESKKQKDRADSYSKELQEQIEQVKNAKGQVETSETKALNEAKKAVKALADLKQANTQTASMLIKDAETSILRLDYSVALSQCRAALSLGDLQDSVHSAISRILQEIAFINTESEFYSDAIATINLIDSSNNFIVNSPNIRQNLLKTIEKIDPSLYSHLQKRYYPTMITVKGDTFTMGDNRFERTKPAHKVKVSNFKIAATETTNFQYFIFAKAKKKIIAPTAWAILGDNPVVNVNWLDVREYLEWLNEKTQAVFRLPTEAEWEFAAKGGIFHTKSSFSGSDNLDEVTWYMQNSNNRTQAVATKKNNALGIYDMSGNVWEWCLDTYDADFYKECDKKGTVSDPLADKIGLPRILKGGAWNNHNNGYIHSSTFRYFELPTHKDNIIGFRCLKFM